MSDSKDTLGDRMKRYEAATTENYFMQGLPLYARIDGRAFHTFTRGLESQFKSAGNGANQFFKAMQYVCKGLVDELNADIGFTQSDEISLGWKNVEKAPFDGRIFKLESVIASQATGYFYKFALDGRLDPYYSLSNDRIKLRERVLNICPTFDCRIYQVPSLDELVNCFVWRENDAIKNSISSYAMEFYSSKQLHQKNQKDRLEMLDEDGHPWRDLPIELRRGTYFARKNKTYDGPEGQYIRTIVEEVFTHEQLAKIENKVGYVFEGEEPVLLQRSLGESGEARKVI